MSLLCLASAGSPAIAAEEAAAKKAASAEVKVGLGIEKYDITGVSESFKVAADTKIYAWTKVSGLESAKVTIAFVKGDKIVSKMELNVPRSPHRTNAYRTFRKGDGGDWVAKVLGPDGAVLGSATFKVEVAEK
jgi:hypothetical protein